MYVQQIPWEANYDESEMPGYTLPELLPPGIDSREKWEKIRRPELLRLFKEVMYGELPPMPDRIHYEGKEYRVIAVKNWQRFGFSKAIAVEKEN